MPRWENSSALGIIVSNYGSKGTKEREVVFLLLCEYVAGNNVISFMKAW